MQTGRISATLVESGTAAFGCAGGESGHPFMEGVAAALDQDASFARRAFKGSSAKICRSTGANRLAAMRPRFSRSAWSGLPAIG